MRDQRYTDEEVIAAFAQERPDIVIDPNFVVRVREKLSTKNAFIFKRAYMQKKWFAFGCVGLAAVVLVVWGVLTPERTLGAELVYVEGAVLYRTGGGVWQEADVDTGLREGDGVKIIGEGKAIILLDDGSAVRLNNDSEATLAALDPEHMQVVNEHGQVYTRVVKAKRLFDVAVNDTIYRSLGTAYMTVNTDETQGVEVYESAVAVITSENSQEEETVVPEGSAYYEVHVEAPATVGEVTVLEAAAVKADEFVTWNQDEDTEIASVQDEVEPKEEEKIAEEAATVVREETKNEVVAVKEEVKEQVQEIKKETKDVIVAMKQEAKELQAAATPGVSTVSRITLTADAPEPGHVSWAVDGNLALGMDRGVRVLFSKTPNPTLGSSLALPVGWKNYSKIWPKEGTGTYYVRVCEFLGDTCGTYSNEVTVTVIGSGATGEYFDKSAGEWKSNRSANGPAASSVSSITLTADSPEREHVSWIVNGTIVQGMDRGVRVLFSKTPNPTLGSSLALPVGYKNFSKIWPKEGTGTYYVRVCEYLGANTCGTYSNEVTVNLVAPG